MLMSAAALGLGLVVTTGGPAAADPYDCGSWTSGQYGYARCTNGTGEFRSYGACDGATQSYKPLPGPWVRVGSTSRFSCRTGDTALWAGVQVR